MGEQKPETMPHLLYEKGIAENKLKRKRHTSAKVFWKEAECTKIYGDSRFGSCNVLTIITVSTRKIKKSTREWGGH